MTDVINGNDIKNTEGANLIGWYGQGLVNQFYFQSGRISILKRSIGFFKGRIVI